VALHVQECVECAARYPLIAARCPGCASTADSALPVRSRPFEARVLLERLAHGRRRDHEELSRVRANLSAYPYRAAS